MHDHLVDIKRERVNISSVYMTVHANYQISFLKKPTLPKKNFLYTQRKGIKLLI